LSSRSVDSAIETLETGEAPRGERPPPDSDFCQLRITSGCESAHELANALHFLFSQSPEPQPECGQKPYWRDKVKSRDQIDGYELDGQFLMRTNCFVTSPFLA
jgi:hypothetical protein